MSLRRCDPRLGPWWCALAWLLALLATNAHALLESCEVSATPLSFGVYDPANPSATDTTGTITVTCTVTLIGLLVSYNIRLSTGSSGSYAPRRLASGVNTLSHNIYTNASHTTVWGDGTAGTSFVSDSRLLLVGTAATQYTMYGRIPALQDVPYGLYSDTLTVTLNF